MKKIFILCALPLVAATLIAAKPSKKQLPAPPAPELQAPSGYLINGEFKADAPDMVYLWKADSTDNINLSQISDSVRVEDGKFRFAGSVAEPTMFLIATSPNLRTAGATVQNFYVENGVTTITRENASSKFVIRGTRFHSEMERLTPLFQNPTHIYDSLRNFIVDNPTSLAALDVVRAAAGYSQLTPAQVENLMALFPESAHSTRDWRLLEEKALPELRKELFAGDKYKDITLSTKDSVATSLSAVLAAHKYVLLDFWASWCGPCRKDIPAIKAAVERFGGKGFTVFGVSVDRDRDAWIKAMGDEGIDTLWPNVIETKENVYSKAYNVKFIPKNYLIAADGTIVATNLHGEELAKKLSELLGE